VCAEQMLEMVMCFFQGRDVVDVNNAQELIRSKLAGLLEDSHTQQQNNDNASAHDASETSAVAPVSPRALQSPLRHKQQYRILALIVHILLAAVAALGIPYGLWISAVSASNQEAISGSIMILQPLLQVAVLHFAAHASWAFAKYVLCPCTQHCFSVCIYWTGRYEQWPNAKQLHAAMAAR
jgi:hypothetical protein